MTSNLRSQTKKTSKKFPLQNLPNNLPKQNWRQHHPPKSSSYLEPRWSMKTAWNDVPAGLGHLGKSVLLWPIWIRIHSGLIPMVAGCSNSDSKRESQQKRVDQRFDVSKFMNSLYRIDTCLSKKDNLQVQKKQDQHISPHLPQNSSNTILPLLRKKNMLNKQTNKP